MIDFKVGDHVKKVRGSLFIGHQGWVKEVFVNPNGTETNDEPTACVYVTGIPDTGKTAGGMVYNGYMAANFEKVVTVEGDQKVEVGAPLEDA